MQAKSAILARDLALHVEPHIHVIALENRLRAVFAVDFYFQFKCQFCLDAAFRNPAIICPDEGVPFRQKVDDVR